jgi:hypothetical protein
MEESATEFLSCLELSALALLLRNNAEILTARVICNRRI